MKLSLFGYTVLALIIAVCLGAFASLVFAWRRRKLYSFDFGTIFLPPIALRVVGAMRTDFSIGWGLTIWPFIFLIIGMFLLIIRVFAIDRFSGHPRRYSIVIFSSLLIVSVLAGFLLPPWYD
jgi:hypothetical protein